MARKTIKENLEKEKVKKLGQLLSMERQRNGILIC